MREQGAEVVVPIWLSGRCAGLFPLSVSVADVLEVVVPAFPSGAGVAAGPADSAISGVPAAADPANIDFG
jgi:hypothetical protein